MSDTLPTMPKLETDDLITATDTRGRVFQMKTLDPADMLNTIEIAGGAAAENQTWLRMAMLLATVSTIDGIPVPVAGTKNQILNNARMIGNDGLICIADATTGTLPSADGAALLTPEAELAASRSL